MKQIFEVRTNPIYQTNGTNKLKAQLEVVLIHTDGKEYKPTPKGGIIATPILRETRFFIGPEDLDQILKGLQLAKVQMEQIKGNCEVLNDVITHMSKTEKQ